MTNEEAANVLRIMASGIELKGYTENWLSGFKEAYEMAIKVLEERKQGEWSDLSTDGRHIGWIACSVCGQEPPNESNLRTDFCPNCGADMRKGDKE